MCYTHAIESRANRRWKSTSLEARADIVTCLNIEYHKQFILQSSHSLPVPPSLSAKP